MIDQGCLRDAHNGGSTKSLNRRPGLAPSKATTARLWARDGASRTVNRASQSFGFGRSINICATAHCPASGSSAQCVCFVDVPRGQAGIGFAARNRAERPLRSGGPYPKPARPPPAWPPLPSGGVRRRFPNCVRTRPAGNPRQQSARAAEMPPRRGSGRLPPAAPACPPVPRPQIPGRAVAPTPRAGSNRFPDQLAEVDPPFPPPRRSSPPLGHRLRQHLPNLRQMPRSSPSERSSP